MKLNKAVSGIVVILLLLSLAGNFFQYKYCKKEVAIETVVHRDTIIRVDTIVRNVRYDSIILYPKPVHIDTINRIQIYRDRALSLNSMFLNITGRVQLLIPSQKLCKTTYCIGPLA